MHNYGTINGGVDLGLGTNTFINYGATFTSTVAGNVRGGDNVDYMTNAGTIRGGVDLGAGDDNLALNMGMSVGGNIDGGLGNDTLTLGEGVANQSQTFNNTVSNVELLLKSGAGKWVLDNNYSFGVFVNAGELNIATTRTVVATGGVVVGGGTFSGQGTVQGNVTVGGGILHPGDGTTGTLTVTGDVTVNAGSFVEVSVVLWTAQTKLAVGGNVNLGGNGTLRVSIAPGFYKANASYDVITAGGAVNGQFASAPLPAGTRFTRFKLNYAPQAVQVQVEKLGYEIIAETYNQGQAASGLTRGLAGPGQGVIWRWSLRHLRDRELMKRCVGL